MRRQAGVSMLAVGLAMSALGVLAVLAASAPTPIGSGVHSDRILPRSSPPDGGSGWDSHWLTTTALAVVALFAAASLIAVLTGLGNALWRLVRLALEFLRASGSGRRRPTRAQPAVFPAGRVGAMGELVDAADRAARERLAAAAAASADTLADVTLDDAADEVIRCWEAVEVAAARTGAPRRPSDTPTEFTAAVLTRLRVDPASLRALLGVYGRARFAADPLGVDDLTAARSAFARVSADLTTGGAS